MKRPGKTFVLFATILLSIVLVGCPDGGNRDGNGGSPLPAEFSISNLSISPTEIYPNNTVVIEVEVENIGGTSGMYGSNAVQITDNATAEYQPQW
jgi:hypothetical protein